LRQSSHRVIEGGAENAAVRLRGVHAAPKLRGLRSAVPFSPGERVGLLAGAQAGARSTRLSRSRRSSITCLLLSGTRQLRQAQARKHGRYEHARSPPALSLSVAGSGGLTCSRTALRPRTARLRTAQAALIGQGQAGVANGVIVVCSALASEGAREGSVASRVRGLELSGRPSAGEPERRERSHGRTSLPRHTGPPDSLSDAPVT